VAETADILIVGGGAAGMSAALAAAENKALSITVVDDNPQLGGQIWRAELGKTRSPEAARLIDSIDRGDIRVVNNAQVFSTAGPNRLSAETPNGRLEIEYKKLIIATGARERFLPFPGWTLLGVFGAGGLQALVKGGLDIAGKRVVIGGTGPLLLAVADYLKTQGARILLIAEQTSAAKIRRFARGLWRSPDKMVQAAALRARLVGIPYQTDCWVTSATRPRVSSPHVSKGSTSSELAVTITRKRRTWTVECDYVACGFHLVPNTELPSLLGCKIEKGFVATDELQRTSIDNVFCAGEPTSIGGVESSLIEARIAGCAAAGFESEARRLFPQRERTRRFTAALDRTFALRSELKHLAAPDTTLCRCEDVKYGELTPYATAREAKLQTRCGMGSCQGRVCGAATEFLFCWERDSIRPPIFPVRMENL
jgi:NADPH-dependent 2,4-dienoyl-CoA reductase/sulfur reductase-like enzyme